MTSLSSKKKKKSQVVKRKVSRPQEAILNSRSERNLFMGGQGSGKTFVIAMLSAFFIKNFPAAVLLIAANTYLQLTRSTLRRVFETWRTLGIVEGVDFVVDKQPPSHFTKIHAKLKSYKHTITFKNGAMIFTASLDNYEAIDGMEIAIAFLDETKDTPEEALTEVIIGRLRQDLIYTDKDGNWYNGKEIAEAAKQAGINVTSFNGLYVFTSPAKVYWLNEFFGINKYYKEIEEVIYSDTTFYNHTEDNRTVVISSTFHNKENLPPNYITNLIRDLSGTPNRLNMLVYGSPVAKTGGEYYSGFERFKHIKRFDDNIRLHLWSSKLPLHISFDFNVAPYMSATVWQVKIEGYKITLRCLKEYAMEHPHNTTEDLCAEIMNDYGGHIPGFFIYGDASGENSNTVSKEDNYDVIYRCLRARLGDDSIRVPKSNPRHVPRRSFVNKVMKTGDLGDRTVVLEIDESCAKLITDLEFVKEDVDGSKKKERIKDKDTGQTYEKYGHHSDTMDYFICEVLSEYFYH